MLEGQGWEVRVQGAEGGHGFRVRMGSLWIKEDAREPKERSSVLCL